MRGGTDSSSRRGLTIPEVLILLVMVGLLVGLAYPGWRRSVEHRKGRGEPVTGATRPAGA